MQTFLSSKIVRSSAVSLFVVGLTVACSVNTASTAKKPATGAAKAPTTKAPASPPKPAAGGKKSNPTVTSNTAQSAPTEVTCSTEEEGVGLCSDQYVVFCAAGKVYALDCAVAFGDGATCGEIDDGTIDCVLP
jgi:hypothetical protein